MDGPDGLIGHAELQIGDSVLMLADPNPQSSSKPPKELGGTTSGLLLYVEDVDKVVAKATEKGATVTMPVEDMFWGDRFGQVTDPFLPVEGRAAVQDGLTLEDLILLDALPLRATTSVEKLTAVAGLSAESVRAGLGRLGLLGLAESHRGGWKRSGTAG